MCETGAFLSDVTLDFMLSCSSSSFFPRALLDQVTFVVLCRFSTMMSDHDNPAQTVICHDVYGNEHETLTSQLQWRPATYGIVIRDDKVLLLKQFGSKYDLPGGGVELGEDPKAAVVREVKEETGIGVVHPVLLGIESTLFRAAHSDNKSYHSLLFYYSCDYAGGDISIDGLDEYERHYAEKAVWFPLSGLDNTEIGSTVDFREYVKQRVHRS